MWVLRKLCSVNCPVTKLYDEGVPLAITSAHKMNNSNNTSDDTSEDTLCFLFEEDGDNVKCVSTYARALISAMS